VVILPPITPEWKRIRFRSRHLSGFGSDDDKDRLNQLLHKLATALAAADWDH
jgi:hypothetical protein